MRSLTGQFHTHFSDIQLLKAIYSINLKCAIVCYSHYHTAHSEGDKELLNYLAKMVIQDEPAYYQALASFPMGHSEFRQVNAILYAAIMSEAVPTDTSQEMAQLQKKFAYALKAGLESKAAKHFNALSGNSQPVVDTFELDISTMLTIAAYIKEMNTKPTEDQSCTSTQKFSFFP